MATSSDQHPYPGQLPYPVGGDQDPGSGPAAKRRKVNTCLQCKSRKVKCDKQRPHCGPCQRRRIPVEGCIWADESDPEILPHHHHHHLATNRSNSDLLGLSDTDARTVLDRITRLELKIRGGASTNDVQDDDFDQHHDGPSQFAFQDVADDIDVSQIDPLALAADVHGDISNLVNATLIDDSNNPTTSTVKQIALADPIDALEAANLFPFAIKASAERTNIILGLLPNDHVVNVLLDTLRSVENGCPLGISWRLIRIQLINLRGEISDWRSAQVQQPDVDLSFLALLFQLMVCAITWKDSKQVIDQGIAASVEQIPELIHRWHHTCQALLAMCDFQHQPNLNTITTVLLFSFHSLATSQWQTAANYADSAETMSRRLGLDRLDSVEKDAERWQAQSESDDPTLRTGAVTAVRKALFQDGEQFAVEQEQRVLGLLRTAKTIREKRLALHRDVLQATLPDRSHLVREAARSLWVSVSWHAEFWNSLSPTLNNSCLTQDKDLTTSKLSGIDQTELPDGESYQYSIPTLPAIHPAFLTLLDQCKTLFRRRRLLFLNSSTPLPDSFSLESIRNEITHIVDTSTVQLASRQLELDILISVICDWLLICLFRSTSPSSSSNITLLHQSSKSIISRLQKLETLSPLAFTLFSPLIQLSVFNSLLILIQTFHQPTTLTIIQIGLSLLSFNNCQSLIQSLLFHFHSTLFPHPPPSISDINKVYLSELIQRISNHSLDPLFFEVLDEYLVSV